MKVRLESARWPASDAASEATASIMSPSLTIAQTRWPTIDCSAVLKRAASILAAIAMPTALPAPCPSGERRRHGDCGQDAGGALQHGGRSEEQTAELQSLTNLVCRHMLARN